jgi:hypothetical protein
MEKHEFLAAVHTEAAAIRVAATIEERSRLNIDTFQPTHMEHCIYGHRGLFFAPGGRLNG